MPRVLSEADVAEFRERLCAVAERLFAEKGPEAVTMRQLTAELGVSPMTPYRYFEDKDEILATVRANGFNRFSEVLEQARIPASDIEDVLLVGGSTLLPGFFSWFEERFERRRVRAWQPFEAVAYGAAVFAGRGAMPAQLGKPYSRNLP